jgi:hypothetical protein
LVGFLVGVLIGFLVGLLVGLLVGFLVGFLVGYLVGLFVGFLVGYLVGLFVGFLVGVLVGLLVGVPVVGLLDGKLHILFATPFVSKMGPTQISSMEYVLEAAIACGIVFSLGHFCKEKPGCVSSPSLGPIFFDVVPTAGPSAAVNCAEYDKNSRTTPSTDTNAIPPEPRILLPSNSTKVKPWLPDVVMRISLYILCESAS